MKRIKFIDLIVFFLPPLLISACVSMPQQNDWIDRNSKALDTMANALNEYGTIGMSSPLLVTPDDRFKFDLKRTPNDYFTEAKTEIQGRAASLQQQANVAAIGISAQIDPNQMSAHLDLVQQYQQDRMRYLHNQSERDRLLGMKQDALYTAARVQLESTLSAAKSQEEPQRSKTVSDAWQQYAAAIQTPETVTAPMYPTAPADNSDAPSLTGTGPQGATQAKTALAGDGKLSSMLGLVGGTNATVNGYNRAALITSAGDTAVQAIFSALGQPQNGDRFAGKKTLFGVAMVSVEPGWRTSEGYAAHLTVRPKFEYVPARKQLAEKLCDRLDESIKKYVEISDGKNCGGEKLAEVNKKNSINNALGEIKNALESSQSGQTLRFKSSGMQTTTGQGKSGNDTLKFVYDIPSAPLPLVSAISPMTDAQNMQLATSVRTREEKALSLALALRSVGARVQANAFFEYLKQMENDVLTRNQETPISAFSTGNQFGYQVGPVVWGMGDPTSNTPRPMYRLTRQTFPALVLIGSDKADLDPIVVCSNCKNDSDEAKMVIYEPRLVFKQMRRWVPISEGTSQEVLKESAVVQMKYEADAAGVFTCKSGSKVRSVLEKWGLCTDQDDVRDHRLLIDEINDRREMLSEELLGSENVQFLPDEFLFDPVEPQLTHVFPEKIQLTKVELGESPESVELLYYGVGLSQLQQDADGVINKNNVNVITGNAEVKSAKYDKKSGLLVNLNIKDDAHPAVILSFPVAGTDKRPLIAPRASLLKAPDAGLEPKITTVIPNAIQLQSVSTGGQTNATVYFSGDNLSRLKICASGNANADGIVVLTGNAKANVECTSKSLIKTELAISSDVPPMVTLGFSVKGLVARHVLAPSVKLLAAKIEPRLILAIPNTVLLNSGSNGNVYTLYFQGEHLDQLDLTESGEIKAGNVVALTGNATVASAKLASNSLLEVTLNNVLNTASSDLILGFLMKDSVGQRIVSPPVKLKVQTPAGGGVATPAVMPSVKMTGVTPGYVTLIRDEKGGLLRFQERTISIFGLNLDALSLDRNDIRVVKGSALISGDARLNKGAIEVGLKFQDASTPIAIQFCIKDKVKDDLLAKVCDQKNPTYVEVPPIDVHVENEVTACNRRDLVCQ